MPPLLWTAYTDVLLGHVFLTHELLVTTIVIHTETVVLLVRHAQA